MSKFFTIAGACALVLSAILWWAPLHNGYSMSTLHGMCSSDLGIMAQGLSAQVQQDCGAVSGIQSFCVFLLIAGIAGLLIGWVTHQPPRDRFLP